MEIERRDEPRLGLLFGLHAGLGLGNKHTFILLPAGLAVGMLTTGARRHFRSRRLWYGCAVAFLLFLPNLAWQAANGWPSIEFYRNADFSKNIPTPPLDVLMWQLITMNPVAAPVFGMQNSYVHWGPPPDSAAAAIIAGPTGEGTVRRLFDDVEPAGVHDCDGCLSWRDEVPIWTGRKPKVRITAVWDQSRHYE